MSWTVIVCGSREGAPPGAAWGWIGKAISGWEREHGRISHVIHGAAKGVDTSAAIWANQARRMCTSVPADWEANGRGAGHIRNAAMLSILKDVAPSDGRAVLAFPGGVGTANMVRIARDAGELVFRCSLVGHSGWQWTDQP